ncbi:hypothetical protein [Arthrobacter sp. SLBN-53]|uniref:hypothetical protein n=1 Tax=Arthrobacter sp. SLBN-53 TaxID=2768412 RepID=UPI00114F1228|nr:hypothetical protein [Arthrobacter sp. SLBN-53]TQK30184.1 hypothetical protein FBY28_3200 [Arthrobacter sp. SLBN-53]
MKWDTHSDCRIPRPAAVLTIVTPVVGAAVVLTELNYGTYGSGVQLSATLVFMLVLLGGDCPGFS